MSDTIRVERMPVMMPALAAVLVFPLALVVVGVVIVNLLSESLMSLGTMTCTTVILAVPIAYLISRSIYMAMRWKKVDNSDGRYCGNCSYDLTGNVSGRCPECGLEVGSCVSSRTCDSVRAVDE